VGSEYDQRPVEAVCEEYVALLAESVRLRFRADVPVGVNLSGGLDSSILLGLIQQVQGADSEVRVFTFATGDERYDELPWVQQMLSNLKHPWSVCYLRVKDVPDLAEAISVSQDEPFGGIPTLAYATVFQRARDEDVIVLMDGQGMDEAWAGYDYYARALEAADPSRLSTVQGTISSPVRPGCLTREFRALGEEDAGFTTPQPFSDALRNLQYRDARYSKLPRALRFNDRISMMSSTELREPFLDHRLFELAMRQPPERKRERHVGKVLLRQMAGKLLPDGIRIAPKRPLQTPQREWLVGPLRAWANDCIEEGLQRYAGEWLDAESVRREWRQFQLGASDNSYYIWQWISVGLSTRNGRTPANAEFTLS
jgi:asparagine synthase (glutamine-hydrolysing)